MEAADEHYIGSVLALRGFPEDRRINRMQLTWVKWKESDEIVRPLDYSRTDRALAVELAGFSGFFARKFPEGSDIGRWALHR